MEQQNTLDVEKLIDCVREYPVLWNSAHGDHLCRSTREISWTNICDNVYPNWSEISYEEQKDQMRTAKQKWRNLRSSYITSQTRVKASKRKFAYTEQLKFLKDFIPTKSKDNERNDDHEKDDHEKDDNEKNDNEKEDVKIIFVDQHDLHDMERNTVIDKEKLIECVRLHPVIWDNTHGDNLCINVREGSWINIAENLFPSWYRMTSEEKKDLMKTLKYKWYKLRARYIYFQSRSDTKRCKFAYSEQLKFMERYLPTKSIESDSDDNEEEDVKMNIGEQHDPTRYKMIAIDKLIEYIRVHPVLWDNTHEDYLSRSIREESWINVCENLFPNWYPMTPEEKKDRMKTIKLKWKNLRYGYITSQSQTETKKSKFPYSEQLKFLENYLPTKSTETDSDDNEEEEGEDVTQRNKMVAVDKLIECIRVHPQIWDNRHEDYPNTSIREEGWIKICENLFPNWSQMTSKEKKDRKKQLTLKWKTLRHGYIRCHTQTETRNIRFAYSEQLKFLEHYLSTNRETDSDDNEEEENVKMTTGEQHGPQRNVRISIDKLIEYIRVHPAIWDNTHEDYLSRNITEESWINVCENLFPNWYPMTPEEKKDRMNRIKIKWKNLRYYHVKSQSRTETKKSKYQYSEQLKFLETKSRETDSDDNEEEEDVKMTTGDQHDPQSNILIDRDKLIECIRVHPVIWDNTHEHYRCSDTTEDSWNNVGEKLFPNWHQMTSKEKKVLIKGIKSKWKTIRKAYLKHRLVRQTNSQLRRSKYWNSEQLKFLDNYVPNRSRETDSDDDEEEEEDVKMVIGEQQVQSASPSLEPYDGVTRVSKRKQTPIKRKILTRRRRSLMRRRRMGVSHTDKAFLFSLLPDYEKLSYEQKLEFRMYALGFFLRVNDENSQLQLNGNH